MKAEIKNEYDFIVLGDHPAALWGAIVLLERGLKVLVLPGSEGEGRNIAPLFAAQSLLLDPSFYPNRDLDPIQVLTPDRRFQVLSTTDRLKDEYFFVSGKNLDENSPPDVELLKGLAYLDRGFETGPILPEDWRIVFSRTNQLIYFPQQPGWLLERFHERIRKMGGDITKPGLLQNVFIEKNAFVGVQLAGSSSIIRSQHVFAATNWNHLQSFFSERSNLKSSPIGWTFEVEIKVGEESVPQGLTSYMIFSQLHAPLVEIHHDRKGAFLLRTVLPYHENSLSRSEQRKIAQRLFKLLAMILPDLEYNLEKMIPDIRDPEKAEQSELPRLLPFQTLDQIPPARLRYALPGIGIQSPIAGISIAYEEANPRAGEWGAYQAVQSAILDWAKRTQRSDFAKINSLV